MRWKWTLLGLEAGTRRKARESGWAGREIRVELDEGEQGEDGRGERGGRGGTGVD